MSFVVPYAPTRIPGFALDPLNLLVRKQSNFSMASPRGALNLQLGAIDQIPETPYWIRLGLSAGRCWLGLVSDIFLELLADISQDVRIEELPEPLRVAMITAALGPPLEQLHGLTRLDIQIEGLEHPDCDHCAQVGIFLGDQLQRSVGALIVDAGTAHLLGELLAGLPDRPPAPWPTLYADLAIEIDAGYALPARDLQHLAPGDLLLPGVGLPLPLRLRPPRGAGFHLQGKLQDHQQILIETIREPLMNEQNTQATIKDLGNLEIELRFELGRSTLSLKELQSLQPGHLFPLPNESSEPVQILANNQLVGRGEIVIIEDQIGIRLTQIMAREE